MVNTLWQKLRRDLQASQGRMIMMVIAIAVGIFGVSTIMSAYTIMTREVSRNYMNTNPASATLEVDKIDDNLLESIRLQPGISDAETGSIITARVEKTPGKWMPLLLFVVKDFDAMRMNKFTHQSGAWPPPKGTILIEREALPLINAKIDSKFNIQTPNGERRNISVSGITHDPGLAPSWMEQTVYGYITIETQAWLGESSALQNIKIKVDRPLDTSSAEHTVSELAIWLKQQGHTVGEIRIPPPGKHPHQSQMTGILAMLLSFSLMALVLSAILTSTIISGMLAQQVRQIGVMKAIGARSRQIAALYIVLVVLLGLAAFIIGLPPGVLAGRAFARVIAKLLNFTLYSEAIPGWVYVIQLLVGVMVPLIAAMYPILRISRITVREAINDFGVSRKMFGARRFDKLLGKIGAFASVRGLDSTFILALRNTFRRRGRLVLTLALLATAGGMFITSLNVKTAWENYIGSAASVRQYDLEIRLNHLESEDRLFSIVNSISGVQKVESWSIAPTALSRPDGLDIVRTYPDGGHGSFAVRSFSEGSKMLRTPLISGRKLKPRDNGTVVLNHTTKAFLPYAKIGDNIELTVNGSPVSLRVVGITREILVPPTAYVSADTFNKIMAQTDLLSSHSEQFKQERASDLSIPSTSIRSNALRIVTAKHDNATRNRIANEVLNALEKENVSIKTVITEEMLDGAISGHIYIFIFALMLMAAIMAVVGALGLMSTMGTSVIERTREFGVMRTIGGKSQTVLHNVVFEGIFIGLMSWVIAVVVSLPLSMGIGNFLGNMAFRSPLPLTLSSTGIVIWFAIILIGSITASAFPARKASQLTVRETLAYI
jgi:putative ABC transport system permease protein